MHLIEKDRSFKGSVLYVGQSYYHNWYLSRELRKLGWKADVLNWDPSEDNQKYYHGEDFRFTYHGSSVNVRSLVDLAQQLKFYADSLKQYDIFHFSNLHCMHYGPYTHMFFKKLFSEYSEVKLLKKLGKKIVYSNNGCRDGVSQTTFSMWGPESVCEICNWKDVPSVCSDESNLAWGKIRNELADFQITIGGNRVDYNDDPRVHEVPEFYCLDRDFWDPDIPVPSNYKLPIPEETVKIYHAVGNYDLRTTGVSKKNIKCTHIYVPLIERMKEEGFKVELIFCNNVPNREVRYHQVQSDIVVDMLTFGWFGANIREAMMLGKPCVCFLRPQWLESVRKEVPEYVDELPVISATPDTVTEILKDLVSNPEKRRKIGKASREFALKWHSAEAGAERLDKIYTELLENV